MKKTSTLFALILLVFISFVSNSSAMEADEKAKIQFFNTFRTIHALLQGVERAFNPPASPSELEGDGEDFPKMAEAVEVMHGRGDSAALFGYATELVAGVTSTDSRAKTSDCKIMAESAVRVGMRARPQHFSPLEEELTPDTGVAIFGNFFREFILEGALDGWLFYLKGTIETKESDEEDRNAYTGFLDSAADVLKSIAMKKSPLDKYVDPNELREACDLRKWLKKNDGHAEYAEKYFRFLDLKVSIQVARDKAMNEGGQYMFNLLKRMRPELASLEEMSNFIPHEQKRWDAEEREEFEDYISTEYGKLNPFEANHLRGFWEKLEGHQYKKLCYKIVCESFDEEYIDSPVHQFVQKIWAVSQLDTIHQKPKEGRSRMPAASIDGTYAPNFGYGMKRSAAYQAWIANPFVRASGDIVMDAYHSMVDFGRSLDISTFLDRFDEYLANGSDQSHPYDEFIPAFERYLLERVFHKPFIGGYGCRLKGQLEKAAKNKDELLNCASGALKELRSFSNDISALRPSEDGILTDTGESPFVLGIGFNGELFDNPDDSDRPQNKIWLTFSKSERKKEGGYLLLTFMRYIAEYPFSGYLTKSVDQDLSQSFEKYKPFIKYHIRQKIEKGHRYEGFMSQLEQDIPFDHLDTKLQSWIKETSNWYHIPEGVSIQFPDELDPEEQDVQCAARGLLFDAVVGRSFSSEYPELIPHLFSHWKDELLERMDEGKAEKVRATERLEEIYDEELQREILDLLDQTVAEVHPELKAIWGPEIDKKFITFVSERIIQIESEVIKIDKKRDRLKEVSSNLKKSRKDVSLKIKETEDALRDIEEKRREIELEKQELPTLTVQQLSREVHNRLRDYFFQGRDVSQCIEPLFSKVSCQDRFFSVFISNQPADYPLPDKAGSRLQLGNRMSYDVIAPCGDKCQCHALGHLYVGDMLCHQSVDHLDHIRQIHGLEGVDDRFMGLEFNPN